MQINNSNPVKLISKMVKTIEEEFEYSQINTTQIENIVSLSTTIFFTGIYKGKIKELNEEGSDHLENKIAELFRNNKSLIEKNISFKSNNEPLKTNLCLKNYMSNQNLGICFLKVKRSYHFFLISKINLSHDRVLNHDNALNKENLLNKNEVIIIDSNNYAYKATAINLLGYNGDLINLYDRIRSILIETCKNDFSKISNSLTNNVVYGKVVNFIQKDNFNKSNLYSDYATIEFKFNNKVYYGFCEKRHLSNYLKNKAKSNTCGSYEVVGETNIPFIVRFIEYIRESNRIEIKLSTNSIKVTEKVIEDALIKNGYSLSNYYFKCIKRIHGSYSQVVSIGKLPHEVIRECSKNLLNERINVKIISDIEKINDFYNGKISFDELIKTINLKSNAVSSKVKLLNDFITSENEDEIVESNQSINDTSVNNSSINNLYDNNLSANKICENDLLDKNSTICDDSLFYYDNPEDSFEEYNLQEYNCNNDLTYDCLLNDYICENNNETHVYRKEHVDNIVNFYKDSHNSISKKSQKNSARRIGKDFESIINKSYEDCYLSKFYSSENKQIVNNSNNVAFLGDVENYSHKNSFINVDNKNDQVIHLNPDLTFQEESDLLFEDYIPEDNTPKNNMEITEEDSNFFEFENVALDYNRYIDENDYYSNSYIIKNSYVNHTLEDIEEVKETDTKKKRKKNLSKRNRHWEKIEKINFEYFYKRKNESSK